jgi:hypothetical protein
MTWQFWGGFEGYYDGTSPRAVFFSDMLDADIRRGD